MTLDEELAAAMETVAQRIRSNQNDLDPGAKAALYSNMRRLIRRSDDMPTAKPAGDPGA